MNWPTPSSTSYNRLRKFGRISQPSIGYYLPTGAC
jgi:hypothetical protein